MTPAILLLKQHAIAFTAHAYEHQREAKNYGLEAVNALNLSRDQVFKTLVCQLISMELVVAILPVAAQLNLKHLAQAAEVKRLDSHRRNKSKPRPVTFSAASAHWPKRSSSEPLLMSRLNAIIRFSSVLADVDSK